MERFLSALSLTLLLWVLATITQAQSPVDAPIDRVVEKTDWTNRLALTDGQNGDQPNWRPEKWVNQTTLAQLLVKTFRPDRGSPQPDLQHLKQTLKEDCQFDSRSEWSDR